MPISSILILPSTATPSTTSVVTITSTSSASSSTVVAAAPATPTATTVTETPSSSSSAISASDAGAISQGHHAPFYIAVVVGSILAIGLVAAVVAWVIRLRLHARRRRENPELPWTNHHTDHDQLEAEKGATFHGRSIHRTKSKDFSSQDTVPWEPCGDRDVGEPKRSNSYVHSSGNSRLAANSGPYMEYQPYPDNLAYPGPMYHGHALRDAYSESLEGHRSLASTLGPLTVANMTPGDASPASSCASTPVTMYTAHTGSTSEHAAQSTSPAPICGSDDSWKTLPLPSQMQHVEQPISEQASWTASLRSNFTQAFNAVAASLPSGAALMIKDTDGDGLIPRPTGSSQRPSLYSLFSRNDSIACKPWTLEEHGDGTGRVLFHDLGPEGYNHGAPQIYRSSDTMVTHPPQSAYNLGSRYGRRPRQPSMRSSLSSASSCSAYSTTSSVPDPNSSAPRLPALARHSTIKLDPMATVYEKKEEDDAFHSQLKRPHVVTRSSSSGCSVTAYYYGVDAVGEEESTDSDDVMQRTLVDRRKIRRVV
ncbi:hypothetical protein C0991_007013 [Blastosporella zonata]|nr:hypothetical protein C0991_007013 [Blastosporella zonata]